MLSRSSFKTGGKSEHCDGYFKTSKLALIPHSLDKRYLLTHHLTRRNFADFSYMLKISMLFLMNLPKILFLKNSENLFCLTVTLL